MKLARYRVGTGPVRAGVVVGDRIVDVSEHAPTGDVLAAWRAGALVLQAAAQRAEADAVPLDAVTLEAPVLPAKFFGVGLNYADHAAEAGLAVPAVPTVFNKQVSCVSGPRAPIERPLASSALDYEGELGVVIGARCRHVPPERAHEVIAGYVVVNDVSVRDWQQATPTITLGKSWDTHGPIGPWLTTADDVADPGALELRTFVNGELRQRSSTRHLIFDCAALVAHLSTVCTLEPGDLIATGTPSGVGAVQDPPAFLVAGDVVRVEIDGLGALENPVVTEASNAPRISPMNEGAPRCGG